MIANPNAISQSHSLIKVRPSLSRESRECDSHSVYFILLQYFENVVVFFGKTSGAPALDQAHTPHYSSSEFAKYNRHAAEPPTRSQKALTEQRTHLFYSVYTQVYILCEPCVLRGTVGAWYTVVKYERHFVAPAPS